MQRRQEIDGESYVRNGKKAGLTGRWRAYSNVYSANKRKVEKNAGIVGWDQVVKVLKCQPELDHRGSHIVIGLRAKKALQRFSSPTLPPPTLQMRKLR